jgi:RNA polymerase sigma-70 factor (ECF subfamily)
MRAEDELQQTVERILKGDGDAFLGLVQRYVPGLRAYLASQLYQLDAVDDLAQETLIAAYRSLDRFRLGEDFGGWLRGIARNKLRKHFEQMQRQSGLMERFRAECAGMLGEAWEERASELQGEALQRMLGCIGRLPERMRRVVRANLDGSRGETLAEELGTTSGAVYQLQYRALKMLRECMSQEEAHGT